jgi:hypothetical protein
VNLEALLVAMGVSATTTGLIVLALRTGGPLIGRLFGAVVKTRAELDAEGPVRCIGWRKEGRVWLPIGGPVTDPYIPMIAYTEEQSDELAYAALMVMLGEGPLAGEYDIGKQRIMRRRGDGRAVSLATSPDSRDGARTTFELFDETHRLTLPRQRETHRTMLANLPKRRKADPWALETTTAPVPGQNSVAESTMEYARSVMDAKVADSRLFFFHRQASEKHDLGTREGRRAAVLEASGPVAEWSDIDGIVEQWDDPTADTAYLERVWLNRPGRARSQAFEIDEWRKLILTTPVEVEGGVPYKAPYVVQEQSDIVLGFDGSLFEDATALVACEVATGYTWIAGLWEKPYRVTDWQVPADEVDATVADMFERFAVWRMNCDPPKWETYVAKWAAEYGAERVVSWYTFRTLQFARACRALSNAILGGHIQHGGDDRLTRHLGAAQRLDIPQLDEDRQPLWRIAKERSDSVNYIDAAVATVLVWEARTAALAEGVGTVVWTAV